MREERRGKGGCNGIHFLVILYVYITRKMVPITGRASSFLVFLEFSKTK